MAAERRRIDPRSWLLWSVSRPFLVYVLVIDALAVAVVAGTATLVPVERRDVAVFAMLTAASVVHLEVMRSIERLRDVHTGGAAYTDLKSIWTFAGLLLLPPPLLVGLIAVGFVHSWWRLRPRPVVYRWVFSASNVVLASAAGCVVLAFAYPGGYPGLPSGGFAVAVIVMAAVVRWGVNRSLASVALMLMQPGRVRWWAAYGPAGDNLIESGALGLGVLAALVIVHAPALMLVLVVPVVVVHRGLLLTQFEHAAHRDPVTGVHNAAFWHELAGRALERARVLRSSVALLLIHLDGRELLDQRGQRVREAALRQVAERIAGSVRGDDLLGRLPGPDLALLLAQVSSADLAELVERLRSAVRGIEVAGVGALTVSIGAAVYPENADTLEGLMEAADLALIAAQTHLRDQARYSKITPTGPAAPRHP